MMTLALRPLAVFVAALAASTSAWAQAGMPVPDLSLEELVNTDVVSASRKTQSLQHVAAAVFVITQEDIARSGARTLADALAMAPGIEVAQIGNNRWAVSARGYNSRFANKLQVLKDGRSVYSPLFSGVFWEAEDTVLEDIERIEIIRGPNAAMWGSNAVNGTINIITKKARDTQGGLLAVRAGTEDKANLTARYGMALGDSGHMRLYAKGGATRASYEPDGGRSNDTGNSGMAGFRADWLMSTGNRFSLIGETYRFSDRDTWAFPDATAAATNYVNLTPSTLRLSGSHLQGRFESLQDDGAELTVQSYIAQRTLDAAGLLKEERTTVDIDVQYRLAPLGAHDLMIGANYRNSHDDITSTQGYASFTGRNSDFRLVSVFVNDEITVVPERFKVTLGGRLENNNYSGTAFQPTARFLWTPNSEQTIWGALSRATRTPSRSDRDGNLAVTVVPPNPLVPFPTLVQYTSNHNDVKPEKLDALELGYRQRFGQTLSLDITAFAHRYRDGMVVSPGAPDLSTLPLGYLTQPLSATNGQKTRINGLEVSMIAQIMPSWRLIPAYTWMHGTSSGLGDPFSESSAQSDVKKMPRHMASLRSQHSFGQAHQLDFWLKYKSRNEAMNIAGQANLDVRYAWRVARSTEVSLVGQNLLHRRTAGYLSDQLPSVPVEIGRSGYLRVDYRF